ncbi:MAG: hypothetical protein IBX55_20500 [Methyloprofundus sp.]|nr:hypothetical protein [Methyloprofundus sp.]
MIDAPAWITAPDFLTALPATAQPLDAGNNLKQSPIRRQRPEHFAEVASLNRHYQAPAITLQSRARRVDCLVIS